MFEFERSNVSSNSLTKVDARRPTNCEDLYAMGHSFKGFYWVAVTIKKVKLVYCDFNEIKGKEKKNAVATQNINQATTNISARSLPYCNVVGSQPCSCHYSKFSDIMQFELSNDEVTRSASSENGTGPQSCEELETIGYTFNGFYMVRFKSSIIKTVYCKFNRTKTERKSEETTTQSTLKPTSKLSLKVFKKLFFVFVLYLYRHNT